MLKKNFIVTCFLLILICVFNFRFTDYMTEILDQSDTSTIHTKIMDTRNQVERRVIEEYGSYDDFSFKYEDLTGSLAVVNVSQFNLKNNYNNLEKKMHDLNSDNVINNLDKIGSNGICQPTAVSMSIRYMVITGSVSYNPRLSSDPLDINNVFYEVVDSYIANGWRGGAAERKLCKNAFNTFFQKNNINLSASYHTTNLLFFVESSNYKRCPAIGHISDANEGHAVTICGYYTIRVKYSTKLYNNIEKCLRFAIINDGWDESYMPDTGGMTQETYDKNYSYINIDDLDAITYIS